MTTAGWIIMAISVGCVCALFTWCMVKVLTTPDETGHLHGFSDETPDVKRDDS